MELEGGFIYFSSRRVITLDQADESEDSCHDFTIIYYTPFFVATTATTHSRI